MHKTLRVIAVALVLSLAGCIQSLGKGDDVAPNSDGTTPGATTPTPSNGTAPRVVNEAPVPVVTLHNDQDPRNTTQRGFKGDVIVLNGTASHDPDGTIASWEWEIYEPFGANATMTPQKHSGARVTNIVFGTEGVKIVRLTVTDNLGKKASTSTFYYRDVSYSYGDQFHWTGPLTETVTETREHKLPVHAGAAVLGAHLVVGGGVKGEVIILDPSGAEHAKGTTETNNVTVVVDHGIPVTGEWTIKVIVTYTPETVECIAGTCAPAIPLAASHDAEYGLDGLVWYGERPESLGPPDDGHGHDH